MTNHTTNPAAITPAVGAEPAGSEGERQPRRQLIHGTPWHVGACNVTIWACDGTLRVCEIGDRSLPAERVVIANQIVTAVNAHAALVTALIESLTIMRGRPDGLARNVIVRAEAALALAEGR